MAENKLSEELRHCLEDDACGDCQYWETETRFICKDLFQKAYEVVKRYEEMEEIWRNYLMFILQKLTEKNTKLDIAA